MDRRLNVFWTNAGKFLMGTLGANFSETLSEIHTFLFNEFNTFA